VLQCPIKSAPVGVLQYLNLFTSPLCTAHLLIKHTGSRNPVSRRTGETITLSPEAARAELSGYLEKLQQASDLGHAFREAATSRSDCSSYRNGGDLGFFGPGQMQAPFEEAAFALPVGEMTQSIVETDSGSHLIYRVA